MQKVHKGLRLHIGIFGRRNVGKSSLLNALTRQSVSIVSEVAGTTTDPVEKPMEMLPIGPVLFIDTAGIDDVGALGRERVQKTRKIIERTDIGLIITAGDDWSDFEKDLLAQFQQLKIPAIVVFNKTDLAQPDPAVLADLEQQKVPVVKTIASKGEGILVMRQALIESVPQEFINPPAILTDLVPPGELVVFVIPIDIEAPKGRLLLPQVQAMREVLDHNAYCIVVKEHHLAGALARLNKPPALVVTDSQAFEQVDKITPPQVPLTSFSILFARFKGDLDEFARGTAAIDNLQPDQKVLVCESCSHHPLCEDIGRVKIPRWLRQHIGGNLEFTTMQGHDFPDDLSSFNLVVHCGSCMSNRREVLWRILQCQQANVPITNYGLTIAATLGILPRALQPFPQALQNYNNAKTTTT